jgi:NAD(P)-dependent dehydrogenase (short-subunit alcohol dehydrogenase family)
MNDTRGTALVTGSTSGIGMAIALRLLKLGRNVVLNYSTNDGRAAEALDRCKSVSPNVLLVKADVSDADAVTGMMRQTISAFGALNILVNNAARVIDRPILEMTESEWDQVVDVNMKGAFLCAQAAAPHMLRQDDGGVILNIGASTGIRARRNGINTCSSKAGLMLITQCLALELAPKVRVNTIIPGLTLTEETGHRFRLNDPDVLRAREESVPLQRIGRPEDIADAALMMLSDEARFITGQRIVVDGGQYMW